MAYIVNLTQPMQLFTIKSTAFKSRPKVYYSLAVTLFFHSVCCIFLVRIKEFKEQ